MELSAEHKLIVSQWIAAGESLPGVQKRLKEELGISLTYLDTRLLMDDLKLQPQDPEPTPASPLSATPEPPPPEPLPDGSVRVTTDTIAVPGTLISGKVVFSDGQSADWYLDQTGRLGLNPATPGYRPTQKDILSFQDELQRLAGGPGY